MKEQGIYIPMNSKYNDTKNLAKKELKWKKDTKIVLTY